MDENERLWRRFAHTGRVTDYLRYRGVIAPDAIAHVKGGTDLWPAKRSSTGSPRG